MIIARSTVFLHSRGRQQTQIGLRLSRNLKLKSLMTKQPLHFEDKINVGFKTFCRTQCVAAPSEVLQHFSKCHKNLLT